MPNDFDPTDIVEQAAATKNGTSDFDAEDIVVPEREPPGTMESALGGAEQGVTLGFADEITGGMQSGMDAGQQFLNKLGLAPESPTQVNARLAAEGVTGDVGPQSILNAYREARDIKRGEQKRMQDAHPLAYGLGEVGGGLLTAPLLPGGLGAAGGLTKEGLVAGPGMAGAAIGGLGGLGYSEADLTRGDITGALGDTARGAQLGAVVGTVAPPLIEQIKQTSAPAMDLLKQIFPKYTKAATKGLEGTDITQPQFQEEAERGVEGLSKQMAGEVTSAQSPEALARQKSMEQLSAQQSALENKRMAIVQEQESAINKQIDDVRSNIDETLNMQKKMNKAKSQEDVKKLNEEMVQNAKDLQTNLGTLKKTLGNSYKEIDDAASKVEMDFDNLDVIQNFQNTLIDQSGLDQGAVNSLMNKLKPIQGKGDFKSYQNLKNSFQQFFENNNTTVRIAAKKAYAQTNKKFADTLREMGQEDLANKLLDTNNKWGATMQLEETFVPTVAPDRITKQMVAEPKTIRTLQSFEKGSPEQMASSEEFLNLFKTLSPEQAQAVQAGAEGMATKMQQAKTLPELPSPTEAAKMDPRIQKLQSLLDEYKSGAAPEVKAIDTQLETIPSEMKAVKTAPTSVEKELSSLDVNNPAKLEKQINDIVRTVGQDKKLTKVHQIFDFLKKKNPEAATQYEQMSKDLADRLSLVKSGPIVRGINKGAVMAKNIKDQTMNLGKTLNDMPEESFAAMGNRIREAARSMGAGKQADAAMQYADMILKSKPGFGRKALINDLSQRPEFREIYRGVSSEEGVEDEQQ